MALRPWQGQVCLNPFPANLAMPRQLGWHGVQCPAIHSPVTYSPETGTVPNEGQKNV